MTQAALPPEIDLVPIDAGAPLVIVDVDEVLGLFMRGFERFVGRRGVEMRITRFALFQSLFRPGAAEHLKTAEGIDLFNAFFATEGADMEAAPGAVVALAGLARSASIVILTNAPGHGREGRSRWLLDHGFPYPLVFNTGVKGPAVAALAARSRGASAFVDDLLPNLDSAAAASPATHRFQMVADERLRPLAFTAPERHRRIDDWPRLGAAIAAALGIGAVA